MIYIYIYIYIYIFNKKNAFSKDNSFAVRFKVALSFLFGKRSAESTLSCEGRDGNRKRQFLPKHVCYINNMFDIFLLIFKCYIYNFIILFFFSFFSIIRGKGKGVNSYILYYIYIYIYILLMVLANESLFY
jgi:hypothetical protein